MCMKYYPEVGLEVVFGAGIAFGDDDLGNRCAFDAIEDEFGLDGFARQDDRRR